MPVRFCTPRWQGLARGLRSIGVAMALVASVALAADFDPQSARFRHFDTSRGLSQDSLLAIVQDHDSSLWLGTQDGLNRYDGFEVEVFRPRRGDSRSLASPWVNALALDAKGQLWVGTPNGLHRFDRHRRDFERLPLPAANGSEEAGRVIHTLEVDATGDVWIGHSHGLSRWRQDKATFESYAPAPGADAISSPAESSVHAIAFRGDGTLWVGTGSDLLRFDPTLGVFSPGLAEFPSHAVAALLRDPQDGLWIATASAGLWHWSAASSAGGEKLDHWQNDPADSTSLGHNQLRSLLLDREQRLWVGSEAGVDLMRSSHDGDTQFLRFRHDRHNRHSLGKGAITAITQDTEGGLWFGAWEGGANLLSPDYNQMLSLNPDVPLTRGMRNTSVRSLRADGMNWWFGTEDGVFRLNERDGEFQEFAATGGLYVYCMAADGDDLWLGTRSGIRVLDRRHDRLSTPSVPDALRSGRVRRLLHDGGRTWVYLQTAGISVLDTRSGQLLAEYPIPSLVMFIIPFDRHTMLAGAQDGLYWFSRDGRRLEHRHPVDGSGKPGALPAAPVDFLRDRAGRLWLGSSGSGLLRMHLDDPRHPQQARFDIHDSGTGLASDLIGALLEDRSGRIWMSTTVGISSFDPDRGHFRNYDRHDGTLDNSYWIDAAAQSDDGRMAFGGFGGVTVFDPDRIEVRAPPTPRLHALQLGNRDALSLLGVDDSANPTALDAGQARSLGLRFSAPEFVAPEQLRFRYRLDGFDSDWVESPAGQRLATYTNLAPGDYRFRVLTRNRDGIDSSAEAQLLLRITPLWWQTLWARSGAVLALGLLVLASIEWRLRSHRQQQLQLEAQVSERTADIAKLGEIGKELTSTLDLENAFERVYRRISERVDAYTFGIVIYRADSNRLYSAYVMEAGQREPGFEFSLDEVDRPAVWCFSERRELVTERKEDLLNYVRQIMPAKFGKMTESVVYLPLMTGERAIGCLTVQSLERHAYSGEQLEFLRALSSYTAIALDNAQSYARLNQALAELQSAQESLVEREKMASLGGLVAGVAHEVNTPIGIALTAASHLHDQWRLIDSDLANNRLSRQRMHEFQAACDEGLRLILGSLERARQLIASFKQVAVDQSSEQRREFDLRTVCEEILFSLRPTYRRSGHEISLDCPAGITLDSFPGALFQILTNLINNSLIHAFPDDRKGQMQISVRAEPDAVELRYRDDGVGMSAEVAARAFEPFFTTRRGSGGSGLGLHLVYNLTTQALGGQILLQQVHEGGCEFRLHIPLRAPLQGTTGEATPVPHQQVMRRRRSDYH